LSRRVAQLRPLGNATTQPAEESATWGATRPMVRDPIFPMTGRELRAQLRAQQDRNSPSQSRNSELAIVAVVAELDDRRTCTECANLSNRGQCLAAWRGEAKAWPWFSPQRYHPVADVPHYCPSYRPLISESDQRTGAERWPYLVPAEDRP
jgi:hypothetical protein